MPTVLVLTLCHPRLMCERTFQEAQQNTDLHLAAHTHTPWCCFGQYSASNASHWLGLQKANAETTAYAALRET